METTQIEQNILLESQMLTRTSTCVIHQEEIDSFGLGLLRALWPPRKIQQIARSTSTRTDFRNESHEDNCKTPGCIVLMRSAKENT
jgi:hypothetical protein